MARSPLADRLTSDPGFYVLDDEDDIEEKVDRHVRDAAFWGAPVGTPLPLPAKYRRDRGEGYSRGRAKAWLKEKRGLDTSVCSRADIKKMVAKDIASRMTISTSQMIRALPEDGRGTRYSDDQKMQMRDALKKNTKLGYITLVALGEHGQIHTIEKFDDRVEGLKRIGYVESGSDEAERRVREACVAAFVREWAATSNDTNAYALALQETAGEEFGIPDLVEWHMTKEMRAKVDSLKRRNHDLYSQFLRAQYDATQEYFADLGVTEIPVFRGFIDLTGKVPWQKRNALVKLRPLSSTSLKYDTARGFMSRGVPDGTKDRIIGMTVGVDRVLSTPVTGVGCWSEDEVVVLGGRVRADLNPMYGVDRVRDIVPALPYNKSDEDADVIVLDDCDRNADWIKSMSWDLPEDDKSLTEVFGPDWRDVLSVLPCWDAVPPSVAGIEAKDGRHVRDAEFWGAPVGTPLPLAGRSVADRAAKPPPKRRVGPPKRRPAPKPPRERAKPGITGQTPSRFVDAFWALAEPGAYEAFYEKYDNGGGCEDISEGVERRFHIPQVYGILIGPNGEREYHAWNEDSRGNIFDAYDWPSFHDGQSGPYIYPPDAPQYEKHGDGVVEGSISFAREPSTAIPDFSMRVGEYSVSAFSGDREIGRLTWFPDKVWRKPDGTPDDSHPLNGGTIAEVEVVEEYRRHGVASAMLDRAREVYPEMDIRHSDALSDNGRAWAEAHPAKEPPTPSPVTDDVRRRIIEEGIDLPEAAIPRLRPVHIVWDGTPEEGRDNIRFDYPLEYPDVAVPLDNVPFEFDPIPEDVTERAVTWHPNSQYMYPRMALSEAFKGVGVGKTDAEVTKERALVKQSLEERISQRIWSASLTDPRLRDWIVKGAGSADEFWDWRNEFKPMGAQAIIDALRNNPDPESWFWTDGLLKKLGINPDLSEDDSEENYRKILRLHRIALLLYKPDIGSNVDLIKGIEHWDDYKDVGDEDLFVRTRVKALVDAWAGTSSGGSMESQAVQRAVTEVFKLHEVTNDLSTIKLAPPGLDAFYNSGEPMYTAFVRATYDETQDFLTANGVEEVWAYRGMQFDIREIPDWALDGITGQQVRDELDARIETARVKFLKDTKRDLMKKPSQMHTSMTRYYIREIMGLHPSADTQLTQMDFTDEQYAEADKRAKAILADDPRKAADMLANLYWNTAGGGRAKDDVRYGYAQELREKHAAKLIHARMNPVSAFSATHGTAARFGGHSTYATTPEGIPPNGVFGVVIKGAVPKERVWSTSITGSGCLTEQEVVVLGGGEEDVFGVEDKMVVLS